MGRFVHCNAGDLRLINVGSGGETYGLGPIGHLHLDLLFDRLPPRTSIVGDAEKMPVASNSVDTIICVGSVINHVVPERLLKELARILRPSGRLFIEFDSTDGLHHAFSSTSHSDEAAVLTFYNSRTLVISEYSYRYVERILICEGFRIEMVESFHILSSLALALRVPPSVAALLAQLDRAASSIRYLRYRGSNLVIVAQRC